MPQGTPGEARESLRAVKSTLKAAADRDPDQEVQGIALPVLDAVVSQARAWLPNSPVVAQIADVISPATIASGEPIRAIDALLVINLLYSELKPLERSTQWARSRP